MEGKIVFVSALLVSLVVLGQIQIQVEAAQVCCSSIATRAMYYACRVGLGPERTCAKMSGCLYVDQCPRGWDNDFLGNTVNEYCKLGCVSSVCGVITTLQVSDASEVVNGAVGKCSDACSAFCTNKASITTAAETA